MSLDLKLVFLSTLTTVLMSSVCIMPVFANDIVKTNIMSEDGFVMSGKAVHTTQILSEDEFYRAKFNRFIPQPSKSTKVNYEYWDYVLDGMVIDQGLSDRVRRFKPFGFKNGRMTMPTGHTSPFRLEGSLVAFSEVAKMPEFRADIKAYCKELEQLGTDIDIASLSRDEQLAYWFNLHNVAVFDIILSNFPKHDLSWMKINGEPFDEAKILTVKGVQISLKDIRHNIVYRNWDDPIVIYGFFPWIYWRP